MPTTAARIVILPIIFQDGPFSMSCLISLQSSLDFFPNCSLFSVSNLAKPARELSVLIIFSVCSSLDKTFSSPAFLSLDKMFNSKNTFVNLSFASSSPQFSSSSLSSMKSTQVKTFSPQFFISGTRSLNRRLMSILSFSSSLFKDY